jgi:uncharacterized protein YciI
MLFMLIALDKPQSLELRLATRPAHLAYWQDSALAAPVYGGPRLGEDGQPKGSVLVIEAADLARARLIFEADPYALAGLFAEMTVEPFRQVFQDGAVL